MDNLQLFNKFPLSLLSSNNNKLKFFSVQTYNHHQIDTRFQLAA